jgi:prepilin signal peptidase PulO-like enzyme (type II secretory pathway)
MRTLAALVAAAAVGVLVARWLAMERAGLPATRRTGQGRGRSMRTRSSGMVDALAHPAALAAGALALALVNRGAPWSEWFQSLLLLVLLYPLALLDALTLQVDQRLVLAGLAARLGSVALWERASLPAAGWGMVAGAGMITLAALAYRAIRGRAGLGEGDAGVLALAGAFVGWHGLFLVLLIAAASGAAVGLAVLLALRKPLDTPIPFVPFLCLGALAVHILQRLGWLANMGIFP